MEKIINAACQGDQRCQKVIVLNSVVIGKMTFDQRLEGGENQGVPFLALDRHPTPTPATSQGGK